MALDSRIAELRDRHKALEQEINSELLHSSSDDLHIAQLKKKKLKLKEEIERLNAGVPAA